jgi:TRAP-type C4-dicarboxylate transport system substrate-binding protein
MWDGFWMLANGKGWEKLPANVEGDHRQELDQAAIEQRAEIFAQNNSLQAELERPGCSSTRWTQSPSARPSSRPTSQGVAGQIRR